VFFSEHGVCWCVCVIELLCCQDAVHLRLRQTQALCPLCEVVLRQWTWHWRVWEQTNQSHLEAIQEETVCEKCRLYVSDRYLHNCQLSHWYLLYLLWSSKQQLYSTATLSGYFSRSEGLICGYFQSIPQTPVVTLTSTNVVISRTEHTHLLPLIFHQTG